MCGISGIYGRTTVDKITEMVQTIQHRGGDGNGIYLDDKIALGHSRLAIIDLSNNAKQPIFNEDQSVIAVVNGEIYNYKELRAELKAKGHMFRSDCDSEVVVHAYEQWGRFCFDQFSGMFAMAIYDKKHDELILARDPIGKKPLYYCKTKDALVFASEIKAILKVVPAEVNFNMIPTYLMYQYSMGAQTLFKNIRKVSPGEMLVVLGKNGREHYLNKYWEIEENSTLRDTTDYRYSVNHIRTLLQESVRLRLQSDVPVGAFLSGGIDSSAVVALWREQSNQEIHTFTATFDGHSEAEYAKAVSDHLSVQFHEVHISADMVARDLSDITWHHDEPLGDAAVINNYYLAREARKYVKVVLAGEGGDEIFGGYQWYRFDPYLNIMRKSPVWMRKFARQWLGSGDPLEWDDKIARILQFPMQETLEEMILYPTTSMSLLNVAWLTGNSYQELRSDVLNRQRTPNVKSLYNKMLGMDCLNLLPEKFLMKADKATMAHALEERLPLLDKNIIEFAFSLPKKLKKDKYILRKAVEDLLPSEIVWRKKAGFGTPVVDWLNNTKMQLTVMHCLRDGKLLKEVCKKESLDKLAKYVSEGKLKSGGALALNVGGMIWNLVALQVWHDRFFGGE
jgi:asparagine synthase (glutamine-hydrolysing)